MIRYQSTVEGIEPAQLVGFFQGWPSPPTPETHRRILESSDEIELAVDEETSNVVGFVTVVTDRVLAAYIPLLEVLPEYQGRGIGQQLVATVLERLRDLYMVDVVCDAEVLPFYEKVGFHPGRSAMLRRWSRQSGVESL